MKYFIRSLKSFVWFICFFTLIVVAMALAIPEYDISTAFVFDGTGMFKAGSQWKIIGMFLAVAAFYPKFTYVRKTALSEKPFEEKRAAIMGVFDNLEYTLVDEDGDKLIFRKSSSAARFMRMFEDTVTITKGDSPFTLEGPRKDLLRLISGIEAACREFS